MIEPVTAQTLSGLPGISHGFFTRHGGVSEGIYASLNCGLGSADDPAAVRENRRRVASHLGAAALQTAHQVHSPTAVIIHRSSTDDDRPKADALVTAERGIAVAVLSADCAPVLFADPRAGVVAAAHAGWRGAVGGVVEQTIEAMLTLGARREDIRAAVGPTIGPQVYEVGPDFERQVLALDGQARGRFHLPPGGLRVHFDLPGYVADRLRRAEVEVADETSGCTFTCNEQFFSYRRSQSRQELDYGRQISAIVLT